MYRSQIELIDLLTPCNSAFITGYSYCFWEKIIIWCEIITKKSKISNQIISKPQNFPKDLLDDYESLNSVDYCPANRFREHFGAFLIFMIEILLQCVTLY